MSNDTIKSLSPEEHSIRTGHTAVVSAVETLLQERDLWRRRALYLGIVAIDEAWEENELKFKVSLTDTEWLDALDFLIGEELPESFEEWQKALQP